MEIKILKRQKAPRPTLMSSLMVEHIAEFLLARIQLPVD